MSQEIDIFETREKAEDYLEPIDVQNLEYENYDSTGLLLEQHLTRDSRGVEQVTISDPSQPREFKSELRELLIHFLEHFAYQQNKLNEMDLHGLVQESLKFK